MDLDELLDTLNAGRTITGDSPLHRVMHQVSQDALRITGELNSGYHQPERVRELLAQLTGKPVDETVTVFPPFRADFGRNITLGKRIFINAGCTLLVGSKSTQPDTGQNTDTHAWDASAPINRLGVGDVTGDGVEARGLGAHRPVPGPDGNGLLPRIPPGAKWHRGSGSV